MIGKSDGFDLKYDGGSRMSSGRRRCDRESAVWTSCAAASMSRDSANCSVMFVEPWSLLEVICSTPGIVANPRSSGVATEAAMVSGLAPEKLARTLIVG
jgi:hypothetical protein